VDASPDEPDDGEPDELTTEDQQRVRRLTGSLQSISIPG
jgi:hypothetical protein